MIMGKRSAFSVGVGIPNTGGVNVGSGVVIGGEGGAGGCATVIVAE